MKKNSLRIIGFVLVVISFITCKNVEYNTLEQILPDGLSTEINPYGKAPLTAQIKAHALQEMKWSYTIAGNSPVTRKSDNFSSNLIIDVIGLYANTENLVEITLEDSKGKSFVDSIYIQTDTLPDAFPEISILKMNANAMQTGMHLCDFAFGVKGKFHSTPFVFDNEGQIRWYLDLSSKELWSAPMNFNAEGNLIFGSRYHLYEYDLMGNEINAWNVDPYFVHHEVIELPNGNIVAAVGKKNTFINNGEELVSSGDDFIIEFNPSKEKIVNEWDLREVLDVDRPGMSKDVKTGDWYHMNAIEYSESDNTLIVSGKHQGVVKVDWDNNLKWIFAPHKGWGKSGKDGDGFETKNYLLTALDSNGEAYNDSIQMGYVSDTVFDWPWSQHAPVLDEDGDVFLFDNGLLRHFSPPPGYSRLVEYRIDDQAKTVQQIWDYGKERGTELFSAIISDVDLLSNSNILGTFGFLRSNDKHYGRIIELSYPDNNEIFEAELIFKDAFGNGYLEWGQIDILYRSERIDFNQK